MSSPHDKRKPRAAPRAGRDGGDDTVALLFEGLDPTDEVPIGRPPAASDERTQVRAAPPDDSDTRTVLRPVPDLLPPDAVGPPDPPPTAQPLAELLSSAASTDDDKTVVRAVPPRPRQVEEPRAPRPSGPPTPPMSPQLAKVDDLGWSGQDGYRDEPILAWIASAVGLAFVGGGLMLLGGVLAFLLASP